MTVTSQPVSQPTVNYRTHKAREQLCPKANNRYIKCVFVCVSVIVFPLIMRDLCRCKHHHHHHHYNRHDHLKQKVETSSITQQYQLVLIQLACETTVSGV